MRFFKRPRERKVQGTGRAAELTAQAFHLVEAGQYDKSIHLLQQAIQVDPEFGDAYNELAFVYGRMLGELDVAEEYALRAVEIDPGNPKFQNAVSGIELARAKRLASRQQIREAMRRRLKHLERTIDENPEYPTLHLAKATALALNGEPREVWEPELRLGEKLYLDRGTSVSSNEPITPEAVATIVARTEHDCIEMNKHWENAPEG